MVLTAFILYISHVLVEQSIQRREAIGLLEGEAVKTFRGAIHFYSCLPENCLQKQSRYS
jgi:hypothetical protein